jgi:hypothetical protein
MNQTLRAKIDRLGMAGLSLGLAGLVACGFGAWPNLRQFFISYLVGYVFWLGLSLGCLGVAMMHHLTGGRWGFVTRRFLEAGYMTLPLMALMFVPLLLGLRSLYPWARPDAMVASEVLRHKAMYLNIPGFCARTLIFMAIWLTMAFCLRRWSLQQDATSSPEPTIRMRALSGPGIVIYPVTGTFAFIDWVMSTEPDWYSTIFLVIVLIGQILSAFSFITVLLFWFKDDAPFRQVVTRTHFHDLGNLLLSFVVFWTYVSFSQLLIIYSGNLPHEINWYLHRIAGGWKGIVWLLVLFHFFVPFFLLLFRVMKQNAARLAVIAALIFFVHAVEGFWLVEPGFFPGGLHVHWLDFTAWAGLGGVWLAAFLWSLKRHPLLPVNDPRIEYSLAEPANAK